MATISSLGVGSGLDLNTILSNLMAAESAPLTQLNTKQTTYKNQLSAYGRIQSAVDKLTSAATKIATASAFKGFQATVANTDYASASASSVAGAGSFSLRVERLAQQNKILSTASPTVAAGTLTLELGNIGTGSFVAKSGTSPVTINFTGSTIEELRAAINDANAGVSASIINGTAGKQLLISSNETGASNTIRVSGTAGLAGLAFDPIAPSSSFTTKSAAQDAKITLEGSELSSATNTFAEAMTGVSITVKKAHDPLVLTDSTSLTIGIDTAGMSTKVSDFVKSWNELNTLRKDLTKYDATTKTGAALSGDSTVANMVSQLRSVLTSAPVGASSEYPTLARLGISLQSDGSLKLDESAFNTAVSTNLSAVTATVTAFGSAFQTATTAMTQSGGIVSNRQDSLNSLIKGLDTRKEEMQRRLDVIKTRYQRQFTALDKMMGQLQTQSTYLTQQLAKLG